MTTDHPPTQNVTGKSTCTAPGSGKVAQAPQLQDTEWPALVLAQKPSDQVPATLFHTGHPPRASNEGVGLPPQGLQPLGDPQHSDQPPPPLLTHGPSKNVRIHDDGFSTVLTKTERQANRHRGNGLPPKAPGGADARTFSLQGAPKVVTHDLYLENVRIPNDALNKDIAMSVIEHAKKNDIRVLSCLVKRNRFVHDQVGCKISVPVTQAQSCKCHNIWPLHVTCRDWVPRGGGNQSSDSWQGNRGNQKSRNSRNGSQWDNGYWDSRYEDDQDKRGNWRSSWEKEEELSGTTDYRSWYDRSTSEWE